MRHRGVGRKGPKGERKVFARLSWLKRNAYRWWLVSIIHVRGHNLTHQADYRPGHCC
jgi:hypothetical protein